MTLSNGEQYIGKVTAVNADNIVFQTSGNYGNESVVIERNRIEKVEAGSDPEDSGLLAAGVSLTAIIIFIELGWLDFRIAGN